MKRLIKRMAAFGFAAVFLWVAPAQAQFFVDCDAGDSIQSALDAQQWAPRADVEFVGTCHEFVTISHDRASIFGFEGATLVGQIRIFGPSNVTLRNFTVTGAGDGLAAFTARTRVRNVDFLSNEGVGVSARDGGTMNLVDCRVADNSGGFGISLSGTNARLVNTQVEGHPDLGVVAVDNASVIANGGFVASNYRGIFAGSGSSVSIDGTHIVDNVIDGILLTGNASAVINGPYIAGNGGHGIDVSLNSSATIQGATIVDNGESGVFISDHSYARVFGTDVNGNALFGLALINDSGATLGEYTNIPENQSGWAVYCNGKESGVEIDKLATVGRKKCPDPKF